MSQERYVQLLGQPFAALLAEQVILVVRQFGWCKPGHVLDQTQYRYIHLVARKHTDALACIGQGHLLGGADHHGPGNGQGLYQCQVDVAGARWQVDEEIVQFAPVGISDQLLQGVAGHGSTPQNGILLVDKEADGEHLDTIILSRFDQFASFGFDHVGTSLLQVEHFGLGGSEDVGIQQAHLVALQSQGNG